MPLLTYGQLRASEVPDNLGVCSTSPEFLQYTNKAVRMAMTRGNFYGTVQKFQVCIYGSCLVWPRYVGTVLAINRCRHPMSMWNNWYQFVPLDRGDFCASGFSLTDGLWRGNLNVVDDGWSPVFNPISCGANNYVRAYPSTQQDIGKTTTIYGIDSNGQVIRTQLADGTWQEGVTLTLALPFVSTPFTMREVQRISKDVTQGVLRYYQYDAVNNVLLDLVAYDPSETTPMYRKSRVGTHRGRGAKCSPCDGLQSIEALVKLEFQPVKFDSDIVQVGNQDALQDLMMSAKLASGGEKDAALKFELSGIHEMQLELENKMPKTQTPVDINPFGSALPSRHGIGAIY